MNSKRSKYQRRIDEIKKLREEAALADQNFFYILNQLAEARTKEDWDIVDQIFAFYGVTLKEQPKKEKKRIITLDD